ncbi:MAG: hypothetical protein GXY84_01330 [Clostridiales bacterium]|nr:hypothetical protein [Clostridiales bacterium]
MDNKAGDFSEEKSPLALKGQHIFFAISTWFLVPSTCRTIGIGVNIHQAKGPGRRPGKPGGFEPPGFFVLSPSS